MSKMDYWVVLEIRNGATLDTAGTLDIPA